MKKPQIKSDISIDKNVVLDNGFSTSVATN
jgi:hypothetical protein